MSLDPEYREFFLRSSKVTSGSTPDQEAGYTNTVKVNGVTKFNRFLKDHFPTEGIFTKLFKSIAFKLNKDDRASSTSQGLVKKSTDDNSEARLANPDTDFTLSVAPHQLPDVVLSVDGSDAVQGAPAEAGGLKLSILRRTLAGLKRKNFKLEVSLSAASSIIKSGPEERLQLAGDAITPGNSKYYGTDAAGTKGWYSNGVIPWESTKRLDVDFSTNSNVTAPINGGDIFTINIPSAGRYKFKAWMPVLLDSANGARFNLTFSAAVTNVKYSIKYLDTATLLYKFLAKKTAVAGNDNFDSFTDGYVEIEGTITVAALGILGLEFGTKAALAGLSKIQQGAYFKAEQII